MWCARFTESQLETLKDLIRIQGEVGADLEGALEALELARWDDLPEAELPWSQVSEQAELQGISEADVVWDMSGRRKEPRRRRASGSRASRTSARPSARASRPASWHSVLVEALARLAAEAALAHQLLDPAGRPVGGIAGVGVERLADRVGDVDADEVEQLSGPIGWEAPSFMQASICAGAMPVRSSSRTASNR